MSLLLDALRRAEDDSRKRKLGATAIDAFVPNTEIESVSSPVSIFAATLTKKMAKFPAELTLQEQTPPSLPVPESESIEPSMLLAAALSPVRDSTASAASLPDFIQANPLAQDKRFVVRINEAVTSPAADPDPRALVQPYGSYARLGSGEAGSVPVGAGWAAAQAAREPVPPASVAVASPVSEARLTSALTARPITETTQRQALLAAGVMAGTRSRKIPNGQQRWQWVLATVALLVALPVVVFFLFGDALFGSFRPLVASIPMTVAPPRVDSLPKSFVDAPETGAGVQSAAAAASASLVGSSLLTANQPGASAALRATSREVAVKVEIPIVAARPLIPAAVSLRKSGAQPLSGSPGNAESAALKSTSLGVALRPNGVKPASLMDAAYAAYQSGQLTEATRLYQEVLRADPTQRDAWLGVAVIAHASNQREPAMDAYKRVLRLEPQNATALAGLSSLIVDAGEPQQESKLREMLARSPQEADLNNALGLVLSGEKRWSEAQPLFFKAHSAAPQEPQFAYNLAVTLDHLRKSSLAAQYYETAIGLAQGRASVFDEARARSRLASLKAVAGTRTFP